MSSLILILIDSPFGSVVGLPCGILFLLINVGQNSEVTLLGILTRRVLGLIYTPSPVSMPDATREARHPMGSRFPGLTLTFNGLRQWSRKKYIADNCQNIISIRKTTVFYID